MAAAAPVEIEVQQGTTDLRFIGKSAEVFFPNAWVSLIGQGHTDIATLGGFVVAYTGAVGEVPLGRTTVPSGDFPDYTAARSDGSVLGDGVARNVPVSTASRIMLHQAVTGLSATTVIGSAVYLVDDDTLTVTKGAATTVLGTAVGIVLGYDGTGTDGTILEFSQAQIVLALLEETVIA